MVDPDETAHYELPHQDLPCLQSPAKSTIFVSVLVL